MSLLHFLFLFTERTEQVFQAIGQPEMITAEYVKKGATVIDVGIHRLDAPDQPKGYRLCGDVKFDEVEKICGAITPTPGGTGAMTTACLLQNTLTARMKKM